MGLHSDLEKHLDLGTLQVGGPEWSDREPSGDTCTRPDIKHLSAPISSATVVELAAVHIHTWAWPGSGKMWWYKNSGWARFGLWRCRILCGDRRSLSNGLNAG